MLAVRTSDIFRRTAGSKFLVDDIAAERQRQAVIFAVPPDAQVFANHQAFVLIRQLAFVNDEAHVRRAGADGLENLIERHDDESKFDEY